jgi:hypothetical protein
MDTTTAKLILASIKPFVDMIMKITALELHYSSLHWMALCRTADCSVILRNDVFPWGKLYLSLDCVGTAMVLIERIRGALVKAQGKPCDISDIVPPDVMDKLGLLYMR